ncbi:ferredoxin reductase [Nocardioides marmotae]|uniref:2Fe-2S iron-sulfur cluster binding domain-containing protein n=1 Tax=Nocardioides marmotae TaxID=2663857 RepID=A0A6I3JF86_9ACTN|nr:ferredoxin reductase [Nocardioides marmotae]MCR6033087.1 2Fe-2S iron-sulfur cluster binding domain-containing protein [Gordonia jinghuaiqii]MBC9732587.1 ferredoxin reductase [Nocardioides marmotae]MTB83706.1 2Fe-2S iron-sulfur cluster binding domain-containing protein [Nocardioides marmotae]MTB96739.1 2Fe-2S iron-sulfur cluster binding domain-containing protein [Nocardioides marmotae]QKE03052.1 ferredoxin reductase [Nocardioides marmotae]
MSITADPTVPVRGRSLRGVLRRVAESAVTPLELDDVLDVFHPLRAGAELRGRIVQVLPETPESATIVLKPGRDWAGHVPGQYVRVGVDVEGVRLWRTYSLTHGPRPDGCISITVKAIPGGVVSNHLVHRARKGQMLQLAQAEGEFVLPQPLPAKLLLVTGGSGITPVIGMLRNLHSKATAPATDIVLVHVNASEGSAIFRAELRALAAAERIRLVERFDDQHGLLDVAVLADLVPDLDERLTYACGPAGLLDALEEHHTARGLELTTERFRPVLVEAGDGEGGGTVTLTGAAGSGATLEVDGATPILDAAEQAGVLMPSGCRMGICMACVLPMREGAVRDLRNGAITVAVPGETGPQGVPIQTCVSTAAGACSIDH